MTVQDDFVPVTLSDPRERPRPDVETTAERAECTCPEFCERDHDTD